ncbi:acetamidase/formamidase family protein [Alcaligenaceae bacterium 429]|uniref:formamidase n=1 Tax=unclassified Paenalcaligenes TaxID=2685726 RepID=UPI001092D661|nr:acetamidase/formamidase family protein [Alcaligenaceae bacterium 429]
MQHIKIKPGAPLSEQAEIGHNRWHPDIPELTSVKPGEEIILECLDFLDAQIKNTDSVNDVRDVDLTRAHPLTGPVHVEGAEPGDILVVDLLDIRCITPVGFSGIFAKENGGGFLVDTFPDADKAIWDLHGMYATSRHIPGVRIGAMMHPGLIGTLPSHDLLREWNRREAPLGAKKQANMPYADTAVLRGLKGAEFDRIAAEAARTVPPREHGGNLDIKNLTIGSRIYFPVYVKGAGLSMGDLHFSQGDGEISFCGAIEMDGAAHLGFDLIKGGMAKYGITAPIYVPGKHDVRYDDWLSFTGISVENRVNTYLDATVAYRQACLAAIDYISRVTDLSPAQAYMLLTAAPVEGRYGGVVDLPNASASVSIPTGIFDTDILPKGALNEAARFGRPGVKTTRG